MEEIPCYQIAGSALAQNAPLPRNPARISIHRPVFHAEFELWSTRLGKHDVNDLHRDLLECKSLWFTRRPCCAIKEGKRATGGTRGDRWDSFKLTASFSPHLNPLRKIDSTWRSQARYKSIFYLHLNGRYPVLESRPAAMRNATDGAHFTHLWARRMGKSADAKTGLLCCARTS